MCEELLDTQIEVAHNLWLRGRSTHEIAEKLLVPEFMVANSLPKIREFNSKKG